MFAVCRVLYTKTVVLFLPMSFIFIGSRRDEKIGGFSCGTVSGIEMKNRQLIMNLPLFFTSEQVYRSDVAISYMGCLEGMLQTLLFLRMGILILSTAGRHPSFTRLRENLAWISMSSACPLKGKEHLPFA